MKTLKILWGTSYVDVISIPAELPRDIASDTNVSVISSATGLPQASKNTVLKYTDTDALIIKNPNSFSLIKVASSYIIATAIILTYINLIGLEWGILECLAKPCQAVDGAAINFILGSNFRKISTPKLTNSYSVSRFRQESKDNILPSPGKWEELEYKYFDYFLSKRWVKVSLLIFWKNVLLKLKPDQFILLMVKFKNTKGDYWTLAPMQRVNNYLEDFIGLNDYLGLRVDIKDEEYKTEPIRSIIFQFMIIPDSELLNKKSIIGDRNQADSSSSFTFKGHNLPTTMDVKYWSNTDYIYEVEREKISGLIHQTVTVKKRKKYF